MALACRRLHTNMVQFLYLHQSILVGYYFFVENLVNTQKVLNFAFIVHSVTNEKYYTDFDNH